METSIEQDFDRQRQEVIECSKMYPHKYAVLMLKPQPQILITLSNPMSAERPGSYVFADHAAIVARKGIVLYDMTEDENREVKPMTVGKRGESLKPRKERSDKGKNKVHAGTVKIARTEGTVPFDSVQNTSVPSIIMICKRFFCANPETGLEVGDGDWEKLRDEVLKHHPDSLFSKMTFRIKKAEWKKKFGNLYE